MMDQLAEYVFVTAKRVCRIEIHQIVTAEGTKPSLVQRIAVHKGRAAGSAEEFGPEKFGKREAGWTNGNAGGIRQRLFANSTVFRENKVEQPAREGF